MKKVLRSALLTRIVQNVSKESALTVILVGSLCVTIATLTLRLVSPLLFKLVETNTDLIQGLNSLSQIIIWIFSGAISIAFWLLRKTKIINRAAKRRSNSRYSTQTTYSDYIRQIVWRHHSAPRMNESFLYDQVQKYLTWVEARSRYIALRGVRFQGRQARLDINIAYVPLKATYEDGNSVHDIALYELLDLGPRIILIGDPGSGKTTVLIYIAWILASAIIQQRPGLCRTRLGLKAAILPLPVLVPLADYANWRQNNSKISNDFSLRAFITFALCNKWRAFKLTQSFFEDLFEEGRSIILLLDGLDEILDVNEQALVREAIENFVTEYETIRVIVTCRTTAHNERVLLGKDFREVKLKPLDADSVLAIINAACKSIYPKEQHSKAEKLLNDIRRLNDKRQQLWGKTIRQFPERPLLVRMFLSGYLHSAGLPHRAELYENTINTLLLPEYAINEETAKRIGSFVGGSSEAHRKLVQHLAFAMHSHDAQPSQEIEENRLRQVLGQIPEYASLIDDFLVLTQLRCTLLEKSPSGTYRFLDIAFQEFLTALYLVEVIGDVQKIAHFFNENRILDNRWREIALLVAGHLNHKAGDFIRQLIKRNSDMALNSDYTYDIQLAAAETAATACVESFHNQTSLSGELSAQLTTLLTDQDVMTNSKPARRAAAGDTLAQLEDLRFRKDAWYLPDEPLLGFVMIKGGSFVTGKHNKRWPENLLTFYIARHLVTVAQFRVFVEDSGIQFQFEERKCLDDLANRPVRLITMIEALQYCKWLTEQLYTWSDTPESLAVLLRQDLSQQAYHIFLPNEEQWQQAACGGDARLYPWGNEPDLQRANCKEAELNNVCAVGLFPNGESPYGVYDMIGNVWEWTSSLNSQAQAWVRGGCWQDEISKINITNRICHPQKHNSSILGFRVALVPNYPD